MTGSCRESIRSRRLAEGWMEERWRVGGYEKRRVAVEAQSELSDGKAADGQRDGHGHPCS